MGQDLARKATPTFKKAWDRERRKLKEGDLLTLFPEAPRPVLHAELYDDASIAEGVAAAFVRLANCVSSARLVNSWARHT